MKSLKLALFILILFLFTNLSSIAYGSTTGVLINGKPISSAVSPVIVDGRVYVEARSILESLGYSIHWNTVEKEISAVKQDRQIKMEIGSNFVTLDTEKDDPEEVYWYNPPIIINGHSMVPLRSIGQINGMTVQWNEVSRTAALLNPNYSEGDSHITIDSFSDNGLKATYYDFVGVWANTSGPMYEKSKYINTSELKFTNHTIYEIVDRQSMEPSSKLISKNDFLRGLRTSDEQGGIRNQFFIVTIKNGEILKISEVYIA